MNSRSAFTKAEVINMIERNKMAIAIASPNADMTFAQKEIDVFYKVLGRMESGVLLERC